MPLFPPGTSWHPGYKASRLYALHPITGTAAIAAVDTIYFVPFALPRPITFVNGAHRVITGGAGSSVKGGIWANSSVSDRPLGAPLYVDNTGVATTATATVTLALGAGSLLADTIYWWGLKATGTLPSLAGMASNTGHFAQLVGGPAAWVTAVTFADAYADNMPTMAEGAAFSNFVSGVGAGLLLT